MGKGNVLSAAFQPVHALINRADAWVHPFPHGTRTFVPRLLMLLHRDVDSIKLLGAAVQDKLQCNAMPQYKSWLESRAVGACVAISCSSLGELARALRPSECFCDQSLTALPKHWPRVGALPRSKGREGLTGIKASKHV